MWQDYSVIFDLSMSGLLKNTYFKIFNKTKFALIPIYLLIIIVTVILWQTISHKSPPLTISPPHIYKHFQ